MSVVGAATVVPGETRAPAHEDAAGRAATRASSLRRGGAWSGANRVAAALASLVVLRLGVGALPTAELALWLLLWASVPLFGIFDLGISNAIVTRIAASRGAGQHDGARRAISSAAAVLLLAGAGSAVVGTAAITLLDPLRFLTGSAAGQASLRSGALVVCAAAAVNIPLGLAPRVLHACQRVDLASRLALVANVAQVVLAAVVANVGGGLSWWIVVVLSPTLLTGVFAWSALMGRRFEPLRPSFRLVSRTEAAALTRTGTVYFGLALAAVVAFETDALVVSAVLGPDRVAALVVPARIFSMIPAVLQMAILPLWPAIADALASGDVAWARRAFRRATVGCASAAVGVGAVAGIALGPLMAVIAPGVARPALGLLLVLVALAVVQSVSVPYAAALSGADVVRPQLAAALAMAPCNVMLSIALVGSLGIAGPPLATVVTQTLLVLVPLTPVLERAWRRQVAVAT